MSTTAFGYDMQKFSLLCGVNALFFTWNVASCH